MAEALAAAQNSLPPYAHKFAPRKYTQHQLFACLVLKEFEKKDYRGICHLLADCPDLRQIIDLKAVPHFTTLQKASRRLLQLKHVRKLLAKTVQRIFRRRKNVLHAAADSSGFDAHHASRYFIHRRDNNRKQGEKRPKKRVAYQHYGKLMLISCCTSHAILAAVASQGPTPDIDQLDTVLAEVPAFATLGHMLLDAGFDSAHNHQLLREDHGIRSTIPPEHGRPPKDPEALPPDQYRRMMKHRFRDGQRPQVYGKRAQVETVFSMLKRNLGPALRGRSHHARQRDLLLRVLTHNITLIFLQLFYRAGHCRFERRRFIGDSRERRRDLMRPLRKIDRGRRLE
ncbi:MAG TPA: transposase [Tepidisphaeraceae bacterium]|nr:transposase [Tepidisphaeraceae bacterium]